MLKLKLNKAETRAIKVLLNNAHLMCRCGCIYPEMSKSKKECYQCPFTLTVESLEKRIEGED